MAQRYSRPDQHNGLAYASQISLLINVRKYIKDRGSSKPV
jgi:hypothetical protein